MQIESLQESNKSKITFIQKYNKNSNKSIIPNYGQITANPFLKQTQKIILTSPQFLPKSEVPSTHSSHFLKDFECIAGAQNLFPILLQITDKYIYVCSKDCFISFHIETPNDYEKVKLPQMPTCFKAYGECLYFGLKSGLIIIYNILTKQTMTTCQQFSFSVLQIEILNRDSFLAMDSQGNIKLFSVSIKSFMDKVIKISISATDIIEQFRVKKRDKIKSLVKNLPFRRDKQKIQQSQNSQISTDSQAKKQGKDWKQNQISKFCILPQQLRVTEQYPLVYYHKGQLKCLTINSLNKKIDQQIIIQNTEGSLGMMQLGEGGFKNSNQAHIILVISIENRILYYRQIHVQQKLQFIKISQISHNHMVYNGKFISNNLLVFMTQQGIELSNVNGQIQLLHKINYQKFSYIDFFNQEQHFNFDKRLLYPNILKITKKQDQNCVWCCLEGKRILLGSVLSWKNFLSAMVDQLEWEKCMKCALMIYKDQITLLGDIPQNFQQRNQAMKSMFQKITLTYLSYSLKNSEDQKKSIQIVHQAIDFMVRTQSFTYLFTTIYQATKSYGLQNKFLQQLEQYVESGSIKWVTQEVLSKIIDHYLCIKNSNENQIQVQETLISNRQHLQTMIINFDLQKMQKSLLLSICLNNQLYQALIHICRQQCDYVTPILKLCGLRFNKMAQLQRLLHQIQLNMKQQKSLGNSQNLKIRLQKTYKNLHKLTQIIFHYLYECLVGRMTEFDNNKAYIQMLQQLIRFIFIPSTLLMLLQSSSQLTFMIFNMIFGAKIMQYIFENAQLFLVKKCEYIQYKKQLNLQYNDRSLQQCVSQILDKQKSIGMYRYSNCASYDQLGNKYHSIFNNYNEYLNGLDVNSDISQQFNIYNNILSIIVYTVATNYLKYHPTAGPLLQNSIIRQLTSCPTSVTQYIQQYQYQLTELELSQLHLYHSHKFITYLILTNSFPIRLGWKLIAYQFMITFPYAFYCYDDGQGHIRISDHQRTSNLYTRKTSRRYSTIQYEEYNEQDKKQNIIISMLMRIIDAIIRQVDKQLTYLYDHRRYIHQQKSNHILADLNKLKQAQTRKILEYLINSMESIVQNKIFSKAFLKSKQYRQQKQQSKSGIFEQQIDLQQSMQYSRKKQYQQLLIPCKCYILDLLQSYDELITTMLSSSRNSVKMELFTYLKNKITLFFQNIRQEDANNKQNKKSQNKSLLQGSVLLKAFNSNLNKLLNFSSQSTLQILLLIAQSSIEKNSMSLHQINLFVNKVKHLPEIQLAFIQKVIHNYEKLLHLTADTQHQRNISAVNIAKNVQQLALRHLQSVLQHKKDQLQDYVLRINYPLQQAFKVCQQCNNKTAMAYILIKSGRNLQGVMLISDLLIATSREVFRDLAKNVQTINTTILIQKMTEQLNKVLQTCTNQYINDIHKGQQIWEKIAQKLFKQLNVKVIDTIPILKIRQILQLYVDKIIKAMFTQVNPEFFIEKFSQNTKMSGIPTRLYLQAHDLVFERLGFKYEINSITKQLLRSFQMKTYQKLLKFNTTGIPLSLTEQKCEQCGYTLYDKTQNFINKEESSIKLSQFGLQDNQVVNIGRILAFNCGHAYHVGCYQQLKQNKKTAEKQRQQMATIKISKKPQFNTCPHCKSQWDGIIYGDLKTDPQRYTDIQRQRKKSILIERKNKLANFDASGYFQVDDKIILLS